MKTNNFSKGNSFSLKNNKIASLVVSVLIGTSILTACSQQFPNNTPGLIQAQTLMSPYAISDLKDLKLSYQDDETSIHDSELITGAKNTFAVKAKKDKSHKKNKAKHNNNENDNNKNEDSNDSENLSTDDIGSQLDSTSEMDANLNSKIKTPPVKQKEIHPAIQETPKNNEETFAQKEKLLKDYEAVLQTKLKVLEKQLELKKVLLKEELNNLKRKDVNVNTSDEIESDKNNQTSTKVTLIKFQDKNDSNNREDKVIKTLSADGKLVKLEHLLTANLEQYTRTYTKIIDFNTDGSQKITIKSETKWPDGKTRTVNEERTIDAANNGSGTGQVVIKTADGQTITYDIKVTLTNSGTVEVEPDDTVPSPSPAPVSSPTAGTSPAASPAASSAPTAIPSAAPTTNPLPAQSSTPATSVAPTAVPSPAPSALPTPVPSPVPTLISTPAAIASPGPIASAVTTPAI